MKSSVTNDFNVAADVLADVLGERARLNVLRMEEAQCAAALADADDDFLVGCRARAC